MIPIDFGVNRSKVKVNDDVKFDAILLADEFLQYFGSESLFIH